MRPSSVIVNVAVDQGGVVETVNRVTSHDKPVYETHGVLHYAVANIPVAVARTSTIALTEEDYTVNYTRTTDSGQSVPVGHAPVSAGSYTAVFALTESGAQKYELTKNSK